MPIWVSILFLFSFLIPVFLIVKTIQQGLTQPRFTDRREVKKLPIGIWIFFLSYYLYVTLMSFTGIFQVNTLPPKVLLFTAIPLTLFYFLVVFRTKLFSEILASVQLSDLVRIHIFRLVGVFFIIGWSYQILPKGFAFVGGIGDIFAAVTAIGVAALIDRKAANYVQLTWVWNLLGLFDIVTVIVSAIVITKQAMENNTPGILEMTKFPFCLIPAFAPATIVFLHVCIFLKLKMENKISTLSKD